MYLSVIIAAAGSSTRMGENVSKVLLPLAGRPLITHSLDLFHCQPEVKEIIVVAAAKDLPLMREVCSPWSKCRVVPGGAERTASVGIAMNQVSHEATHIAVHDGARPLLCQEDLRRLINVMEEEQAATLAAPVTDSIKLHQDGLISHNLPREALAAAQTPQIFVAGLLRLAYTRAAAEGRTANDDAELVFALNTPIALIRATAENFKITYPGDMVRAELVLAQRQGRALVETRVGNGWDSHGLTGGRRLVIGGVDIPHSLGLAGHSDADVLLHALIDALLGAAALGDIGGFFPDTDPAYADADSRDLLRQTANLLYQAGWEPVNIDATLILDQPKLAPYISHMRRNIAQDLNLEEARVSVKAKTAEALPGFKLSVCCQATAMIRCRPLAGGVNLREDEPPELNKENE